MSWLFWAQKDISLFNLSFKLLPGVAVGDAAADQPINDLALIKIENCSPKFNNCKFTALSSGKISKLGIKGRVQGRFWNIYFSWMLYSCKRVRIWSIFHQLWDIWLRTWWNCVRQPFGWNHDWLFHFQQSTRWYHVHFKIKTSFSKLSDLQWQRCRSITSWS